MKILRIFPTRTNCTPTDELALSGDRCWPGFDMFIPEVDEVHISVVFSWDVGKARALQAQWGKRQPAPVLIGGPAMSGTAPGEFTPGMYIREGITITSRGCIRKCPWCLVPEREGAIRTLRIHPGNIIQDNNLLACPDDHVRKVFAMLRGQHAIEFKGGLDARLLRQWHVEEMRRLKIKEMWFAADDDAGVEMLDKISLRDWRRDQKRAYVLAGFGGDTIDEAECRARRVWWAGFLPYMQFYRGKDEQDFTRPWRDLVALWCQPKLTKDHMKAKP